MHGVCSVKLCRSEGEAVITLYGEDYRITMADYEAIGIADGESVEDEKASLLAEAAEKLSCIKKAFTYLSYRALPSFKLFQKLKTAGFSKDAVEKTIDAKRRAVFLNILNF